MGVTTGGLFAGEYQIITIEVPDAPTESADLAKELQEVIDSFNNQMGARQLEVQ